MKLLLSSLLLASLCTISSWSVSSGTLVVTQSPDVSVTEGEAVNITCCWTLGFGRMRVIWLKNQTNTNTTEISSLKNQSQGLMPNEKSNCSDLTLMNVTREDSGRYICTVTVDIPFLKVVHGSGTIITVTAKDDTMDNTSGGHQGSTGNPPQLLIIISLAAVASLLLIILIYFCTQRRRRAQAAKVIYEVPHIDSEEAEMDKHSTSSSRGSSQWCQVPVYESFDYFERVQTKESG